MLKLTYYFTPKPILCLHPSNNHLLNQLSPYYYLTLILRSSKVSSAIHLINFNQRPK